MLTNVIQTDAALPSGPNQSAFPFQSSGQGAINFAGTLHSAEQSRSPVLVRSQAETTPVTGRRKSADKDLAKNSRTSALEQVTLAVNSLPLEDAKPSSRLAANLEMMPALPTNITASLTAQDPTPSSAANWHSGATSGLTTGADPAKQGASVASADQVQKDAATLNPATVLDYGLSVAALSDSKQLPNEREALAYATASKSVVEASLTNPSSDVALSSAGTDASAQFLGIVDNAGPGFLAATIPNKMAHAADPASSAANVVSGADKSTSDSKPQTGNGAPRAFAATPVSAGMPLHPVNPASGKENAAERVIRPSSDNNLQTGDSSSHESKLPSASTVSSPSFSAEITEPISLPATMVRVTETLSPSGAHAKEGSAGRVLSNQTQATSKPADSSTNPADTNAQPASLRVAPPAASTGPASTGEQPGGTMATANVLAQVSPAPTQDPGSRSTGLPTTGNQSSLTEHQSPVASSPTPLPVLGTVEVARLVAGAAQSEMHIGLRTQAFGSVEVHTVVRDSQVGLTVGSERGDLRTLLAPEVSGLQTTFRQQDLRFDSIHFLETSAGTTAGFSGGAHSQARSPSQHSFPTTSFSIQSRQENPTELDVDTGLRSRLNVHA